jgi:hypothetical protein
MILYTKLFHAILVELPILYLVPELIQNKTLLKQFNDDFEKYAPINFFYERGTERSKEISRCLREFYLGEEPLSNASFSGLSKVQFCIIRKKINFRNHSRSIKI